MRSTGATCGGSVASAFVDDVQQRLAAAKALHVLQKQGAIALERAWRQTGRMRGDQDVRLGPQRRVGRQRLGIGDVEAGAGKVARTKRCEQRRLVDDGAATDVV